MKTNVYGVDIEYTDERDLARKVEQIRAKQQEEYNRMFSVKVDATHAPEPTPELEPEVVVEDEVVDQEPETPEIEEDETPVEESEEINEEEEVVEENPAPTHKGGKNRNNRRK